VATLYQKVEIFYIYFWGRIPTPCGDWGEILHSQADPGARRPCKVWPEPVQRVAPVGRIFGLWVNLIPAVCRLAAILPVIKEVTVASSATHILSFSFCHYVTTDVFPSTSVEFSRSQAAR